MGDHTPHLGGVVAGPPHSPVGAARAAAISIAKLMISWQESVTECHPHARDADS